MMRRLEEDGVTITHDWTREVEDHLEREPTPEELFAYAEADYAGVRDCDVLVALTSERLDWGCALWTEIGIALALGKQIIIAGPQKDRNIFSNLCVRVDSGLDAVEIIREMV